jgi:uncharacterized protein with PIN domain
MANKEIKFTEEELREQRIEGKQNWFRRKFCKSVIKIVDNMTNKRYCESVHNGHRHSWGYIDNRCLNCNKILKELNQR